MKKWLERERERVRNWNMKKIKKIKRKGKKGESIKGDAYKNIRRKMNERRKYIKEEEREKKL